MRRGNRPADTTISQIILRHLFTPFNAFNFAIGLCLAAVGAYRNLLYLCVIAANILIGIVQDVRSKRIVDKLTLLTAPQVTVMRGGDKQTIPPEALEQGEIFCLSRGNQICADATVLQGEIRVNEALLTGESAQVKKAVGASLLSGSFVTAGFCVARADKVGEDCYAAVVAREAKRKKENNSIILYSLNKIVRFTSLFILPLGAILFCESYVAKGAALDTSVVTTSAALLGLLPKGLVLLTSVSLAVGVVRLGKKRALVQELFGIEALARVDVLCMDKTGTLTQGVMKVDKLLPLQGSVISAADERAMAAFCHAFHEESPVLMALRQRFTCEAMESAIAVVPFSSERAWSAACFENTGAFYLGAPERMLSVIPQSIKRVQREGAQVLIFAAADEYRMDLLPATLTPIFAICLQDTVRPEAIETLRYFEKQNVRLMILSGDSVHATKAIASQAGLTGPALDARTLASQEDFDAAVKGYSLFGGMLPAQKKELVEALQRQKHTVGFLGDGVNDVLAIHQADCGVALASGCDAARRAAKLVLMDSSFTSLPKVVSEGRRVVNNIKRVAPLFLTKTCFSFLLSFVCALTGVQYPFTPLQLSIYSLLFEALPALVLTFRPNAARIEGDIVRDALRKALPFALAISAGVMLTHFAEQNILVLKDMGTWPEFAWTCCMGAVLVLRVVTERRRGCKYS